MKMDRTTRRRIQKALDKGQELYQCASRECRKFWTGDVGPQNDCPRCKGLYIHWLSYDPARFPHAPRG